MRQIRICKKQMSSSCERLVFLGFYDVMDDIEKCDWLTDWLTQWPWPAISRIAFATKDSRLDWPNEKRLSCCQIQHSRCVTSKYHHRRASQLKIKLKTDSKSESEESKYRSVLKQRSPQIRGTTERESRELSEAERRRRERETALVAARKRRERSLKDCEARQVHNLLERQRRSDLNVNFDNLRLVLPQLAGVDKPSKQQILDEAAATVRRVQAAEETLRRRRRSLDRRREQARRLLRTLREQTFILEPQPYIQRILEYEI